MDKAPTLRQLQHKVDAITKLVQDQDNCEAESQLDELWIALKNLADEQEAGRLCVQIKPGKLPRRKPYINIDQSILDDDD